MKKCATICLRYSLWLLSMRLHQSCALLPSIISLMIPTKKMANDRQDNLEHGTHEVLLGAEYDVNDTSVRDKKVAKKVGNLRYFLYLYI